MSFSKGNLFHIEMRNGIYQVLGVYGLDDKGNVHSGKVSLISDDPAV